MASFAFGLILLIVLHVPILQFMAHWLDVGESPRAADFVMVLPGGPETRPFVAAAMMRAGLAKGVLTSQTETDPANDDGLTLTDDAVMRRTLLLRGIRDEQIIVLPGKSNSTWTDALALAKFLQGRPETTVAIVTDCFHTRRSRWVFKKVLRNQFHQVYFVSAQLDNVSGRFLVDDRRRAFDIHQRVCETDHLRRY